MTTEIISLKTDDGHELQAYVARPDGEAKGGIVVIQEIFGLTEHIRTMTERFAAAGFLDIAPAMFDRV
jgi:carboxymethylenebutenolidase